MIWNKNSYLKIALVLSAFFLCAPVFAQAFGELLPGSKELSYDAKKGIHKLLGGANFIYQGNTFYSDSAYYFEKNKSIRAYGNVQIRKSDNINLFCDSLEYFSSNGMATMWGKVRATDAEYRLTTNELLYNTRKEQGVFYNGGKIENQFKNEVLTSQIGYFYPKTKDFFFKTNVDYKSDSLQMTTDSLQYKYAKKTVYFNGSTCITTDSVNMEAEKGWYNVQSGDGSLVRNALIEQKNRTIFGDSLLYSKNNKIAEGFSNVFIKDTTEKIAFSGNYAYLNDSLKYSLLTDDALVIKYMKNDTMYMHADTLYNLNDSMNNRVLTLGYHNVKIFGKSVQGIGDSLSFAKKDGYMELFKNPMLWSRKGELKGDSMRVYMDDSLVHEARIWGKATAIMQVDSIGYYNQVGGNYLYAYFDKNQLTSAKVVGNAQTIFYPEEEKKKVKEEEALLDDVAVVDTIIIKRMGLNRFFASEIKVYFDSGEVTGVTYYDKPDGVFYPMDQIDPKDQYVRYFSTNYALRPKSVQDILLKK